MMGVTDRLKRNEPASQSNDESEQETAKTKAPKVSATEDYTVGSDSASSFEASDETGDEEETFAATNDSEQTSEKHETDALVKTPVKESETSTTEPLPNVDEKKLSNTPVATETLAKPKFVFGSAAKSLVSFTALAAKSTLNVDFAVDATAEDNDSKITTRNEDENNNDGRDSIIKETGETNVFLEPIKKKTSFIASAATSTGEENETTIFTSRAKLFALESTKDSGKDEAKSDSANATATLEWHERGVGVIKINENNDEQDGARIIMRAEGILKLLLNVRLFKGMNFEIVQGRSIRFAALTEEMKTVSFLLRFKSFDEATNFAARLSYYCDDEDDNLKPESEETQI